MFKRQHDELHSFLEWRRQTRFIRHYGGPIMALTLFAAGLWFVWRACNSRAASQRARTEINHQQEVDHLLQASESPKL
ncbi:MAG TPA: hypothetical protein PLB55_21745 [Prosthecobacter sp.]|jgi:predicted negative regulator of RcsB-dependent stress response|nr:hypothetical protein [Prosthecobacter sp.]